MSNTTGAKSSAMLLCCQVAEEGTLGYTQGFVARNNQILPSTFDIKQETIFTES
jgi:hypothetical protein